MNYSKTGIIVMFSMSMIGLIIGIEYWQERTVAVVGFTLFTLCTYVYSECIYSEMRYRKRNRKVTILEKLKPGMSLKSKVEKKFVVIWESPLYETKSDIKDIDFFVIENGFVCSEIELISNLGLDEAIKLEDINIYRIR